MTDEPLLIRTLGDRPKAEFISLLLFGPAKVGKTHQIGLLGPRVLYICFSDADGSETLKNFSGLDNMLQVIIPQGAGAYDKALLTINKALDTMNDKFDFIVIDEFTAFRRAGMWKAVDLNADEKKSKSKGKRDRRDGIIMPTISDYGTEMNLTEHFIASAIEICAEEQKHFIAVAHERLTYYKAEGAPISAPDTLQRIRPAFTGKTAPDDIVAYFDAVLYMEVVNGNVHRMKTVGDSVLVAGHRFGDVLKPIELRPDLSEIIERIKSR